jgi:glyoxylase-like metal-dependent hydrolase (beta-lactamase superfamily II)
LLIPPGAGESERLARTQPKESDVDDGLEYRCAYIGFANGWLIRSRKGAVLVDAGYDRQEGKVAYALRRMGYRPRDLRLIIVTHAHLDHFGSLAAIKKHTGATTMVHEAEVEYLRTGAPLMPKGLSMWGRMWLAVGRKFPEILNVPPVEPDILVSGELDLSEWGIDARLVETPGHSPGSMSVLFKGGTAFAGDVAVSTFRGRFGVRAAGFGDDPDALAASWRKLVDAGVRLICPGHGKPYGVECLRRLIEKVDGQGHLPVL